MPEGECTLCIAVVAFDHHAGAAPPRHGKINDGIRFTYRSDASDRMAGYCMLAKGIAA